MTISIKRFASYFKRDWNINDYPIELYLNPNASEENIAFGARVQLWPIMVAHGRTKELAFEKLSEQFESFKAKNKLPRPGTNVPIQFASTGNVDKYEELAVEFFRQILSLNYHECFISDESSLTDFENMDGSTEPTQFRNYCIARVKEIYEVDIADEYDKHLLDIFAKIKSARNNI